MLAASWFETAQEHLLTMRALILLTLRSAERVSKNEALSGLIVRGGATAKSTQAEKPR